MGELSVERCSTNSVDAWVDDRRRLTKEVVGEVDAG
jgi:hypothetical protein